MLITVFEYPGVNAILSAQAETSQGIQPGRCTATCPASAIGTLAPVADLAFGDGTTTIVWKQCRVVQFAYSGGSGQKPTATVLFEDRRFNWASGSISGRYNVPAEYTNTVPLVSFSGAPQPNQNYAQVPIPPGEEPIRPETAKTAQQLCILCLKAMGETQYDVSAIDPKAYPAVEWDTENPARALQALAERFGCRVVYRWDTDSVVLVKQGVGGPLPSGPFLFDSPSLTPKPVPKRVVVRSAKIKYQMRFALEMVLMEFDGSWKPADQVSYRPTNGWFGIAPGAGELDEDNLPNLPKGRTVHDAISLAGSWLYRTYRVSLTRADGLGVLRIPADGGEKDRVDYHKQVYLLPSKAQVTVDDLNRHSPAPAQVYGRHTPPQGYGLSNPMTTYDQTTTQTEVLCPFSIDPEHAIIVFAEPIYAFKPIPQASGGNGKTRAFYPATIVLETACHFAPKGNWQMRRRDFGLDIPGGLSTLALHVIKEQLLANSVASYDANNVLTTVKTNDTELQPRANYYLAGELAKLVTNAAETTKYSGTVPIVPDGAISQVTFAFAAGDKNCPATTASLNTEHSVYLPTYEGRRLREEADLRPQAAEAERQANADRVNKGDGGGALP